MQVVYDTVSTRDAFGEALYKLALKDDNIFCIGPDTTKNMGMGRIEKEMPERCYNVGICEQNAALMAAGLASCGAKAFVATYSTFASMRMLEQVRTFCAYTNLDVKVIAGMSGLAGGAEGVTHQGSEDMSLMRSIANMVVVSPADAASARVITRAITNYRGPVYLRLGKNSVPKVFDESYTFEIGKANWLHDGGKDASIVFTGAVASRAMQAYETLCAQGISVDLIEMPCVKPVDEESLLRAAKKTGAIVTVEDNNIIGGLGSAVAEVLSEQYPTLIKRIGVPDCFAESGDEAELLDKYGVTADAVVQAVRTLMEKKKA